jgi:hypothetical protein
MIALLLAPVGLMAWVLILRRWRDGLLLLIGYLPFGGVLVLYARNPLATLGKDILFIVPLYLTFVLRGAWRSRGERFHHSITIALGLLAIVVVLQAANPGLVGPIVALVGIKVWLLYIPLLFVTYAAINRPQDLRLFLRTMILFAPIPCAVGLLQFIGSNTIGHEETLTAFYGDAAAGASQNFAAFDYGARLYRLPSTFTSVSQYSGYLQATLFPAYCVARADTSPAWRRYAGLLLALLVISGLLCGARSALVFIPASLIIILVADRVLVGALTWVATIPTLLMLTLTVAGFDLERLFSGVSDLAIQNATGLSQDTVVEALRQFPLGAGTGMNTIGARHVAPVGAALILYESHYAKTVVELGIPGLVVMTAIYLILIWRAWSVRRLAKGTPWASVAAAILAFFLLVPVHSLKGWPLDWEPCSVYFWILGGFVYSLPKLINSDRTGVSAQPRLRTGVITPRPLRLDLIAEARRSRYHG